MRVRQFQREFGKINSGLQPGEKIHVTKYGELHGTYQRARGAKSRKVNAILREHRNFILHPPYALADGAKVIRLLEADRE